ncbi:MAG: caspase family protein [Bacteroidota bacterium]
MKRKALLIGCNHYVGRDRLQGSINTVYLWLQLLIEYGFEYEDITLLYLPKEAVKENILDQMEYFLKSLNSGDFGVILYSGHADRQSNKNFLSVPDGKIYASELNTLLQQSLKETAKLLFVGDCCFAGGLLYQQIKEQGEKMVANTNRISELEYEINKLLGQEDDDLQEDIRSIQNEIHQLEEENAVYIQKREAFDKEQDKKLDILNLEKEATLDILENTTTTLNVLGNTTTPQNKLDNVILFAASDNFNNAWQVLYDLDISQANMNFGVYLGVFSALAYEILANKYDSPKILSNQEAMDQIKALVRNFDPKMNSKIICRNNNLIHEPIFATRLILKNTKMEHVKIDSNNRLLLANNQPLINLQLRGEYSGHEWIQRDGYTALVIFLRNSCTATNFVLQDIDATGKIKEGDEFRILFWLDDDAVTTYSSVEGFYEDYLDLKAHDVDTKYSAFDGLIKKHNREIIKKIKTVAQASLVRNEIICTEDTIIADLIDKHVDKSLTPPQLIKDIKNELTNTLINDECKCGHASPKNPLRPRGGGGGIVGLVVA